MSVFTRREIQEKLNTFSRIVGKKKLNQIVKLLNIEGNESNEKRILESLATTWEVVILAAFCELGDTKYEKKISNGKKPDIFFSDQGISLIGDVFTVSDDQQHKKNPVEEFSKIIGKIWREFGLQKGSLSWHIDSVNLEPPPTQRTFGDWEPLQLSSSSRIIHRGSLTRLRLPPLNHLEEYLHIKICPFIQEIHRSPHNPRVLDIDEQYDDQITVRFSITYDPEGGNFWSGSYASYTTVTDIERHVLWRRLMEKREQFALASEEYPRVLFICDGGCAALNGSLSSSPEYRIQDILDHFWRRQEYSEDLGWSWIDETDISAVIVLSIESINFPFGLPLGGEFTLKPRLYLNPRCQFPLDDACAQLLSKVVSKLPTPIESPSNALRSMTQNPTSSRHHEVLTMSENRIEMSSIDLLRILSGELSIEEFCWTYKLDSNPFRNALLKCRTIKSVNVETAENRDDDKVIIEFRTYDAAIGSFTIPNDIQKPYS